MTFTEKQKIQQRIYGACEKCLLAPENPFTLDNPDVITANGNKLYAIYIPTYRENENMDHLLRRLYLSQLSYGYNMIPVLLAQDEGTRKILNNPVIERSFVLTSTSIEDVISFVNQESPIYRRFKYCSGLQTIQYLSYRRLLQLSEESHRIFRTKFAPTNLKDQDYVVARSWTTDYRRESKSFQKTPIGFLATVEKKGKEGFRSAFEQLMTVAFMSRFNYDDGEIYPSRMFNELSVLNTNWIMFDSNLVPNAYNQMLSFIGLAPVSISTDNELEMIFEKYQIIRNHVVG